MIISQIVGGLGNQLFQYAAARNLSLLLGQDIKLDLSFYDQYHKPDIFRLDKFKVTYNLASEDEIKQLKRIQRNGIMYKILRRLFKKPFYRNGKRHFDPKWFYNNNSNKLKNYSDIYLSGYFASQFFFDEIEDVLRKEFTLKEEMNVENKIMKGQISRVNSVSLHIRRGDYLKSSFFANIPSSYYENAISIIQEKVKNTVFFIFSDDLQWVNDNLNFNAEVVFVDINADKTDYMELMLMATCKHNIIANSTFSWWGAWLNNNQNKIVIAPKVWYNDPGAQASYLSGKIYQQGWQKI